jgi:hypothetical protein
MASNSAAIAAHQAFMLHPELRETRKVSTVANLPANLEFVSASQDVEAIKYNLSEMGIEDAGAYDSFFERHDNDYIEVWGMVGIIPYKSKLATRLLLDEPEPHGRCKDAGCVN